MVVRLGAELGAELGLVAMKKKKTRRTDGWEPKPPKGVPVDKEGWPPKGF